MCSRRYSRRRRRSHLVYTVFQLNQKVKSSGREMFNVAGGRGGRIERERERWKLPKTFLPLQEGRCYYMQKDKKIGISPHISNRSVPMPSRTHIHKLNYGLSLLLLESYFFCLHLPFFTHFLYKKCPTDDGGALVPSLAVTQSSLFI